MVKPQQHQRRLTKQELKKIKQQQQLKKHNQLKKDETQIPKVPKTKGGVPKKYVVAGAKEP